MKLRTFGTLSLSKSSRTNSIKQVCLGSFLEHVQYSIHETNPEDMSFYDMIFHRDFHCNTN